MAENLVQYIIGLFAYKGITVNSNDPRVKFLEAMAEHEGTFGTTNPNDPFDLTSAMGVAGATPMSGNTAGVQTFSTQQEGYDAFWRFVEAGTDASFGRYLQSPGATTAQLTKALADSGWSSGLSTPTARADSANYAAEIGQAAGLPATEAQAAAGSMGTGQGATAGGLSAPAPTAGATPPDYETQGWNVAYTGPNAYKGFDLGTLSGPDRQQAIRAIDALNSNPSLAQSILSNIFKEYQQYSWLTSVPAVRTVLLAATYNHWPENQFIGALTNTNWYQSTSASVRLWEQDEAVDPATAKEAVLQAEARATNIANSLGVQLTGQQLAQIGFNITSQSVNADGIFVNNVLSDQQIYQMVTQTLNQPPGAPIPDTGTTDPFSQKLLGELGVSQSAAPPSSPNANLVADEHAFRTAQDTLEAATAAYRTHKDPTTEAAVKAAQKSYASAQFKLQQTQAAANTPAPIAPSSPGAPGSTSPGATGVPTAPGTGGMVTGTSGGDSEALYNAFTTIARNYYLNLTPQQIQNYVNQALQGDTGQGNFQSGAIAGFTTQAQTMAKSMYPALASIIGTTSSTGTDNTPYAALAGYRSLIATYTGYGSDPDTIDLSSPQWSWILSGKAPPGSTPTTGATGTSSTSSSSGSALPTYDQVQSYLMGTPQFQTTDLAKQMGWHVGSAILKAFGFS